MTIGRRITERESFVAFVGLGIVAILFFPASLAKASGLTYSQIIRDEAAFVASAQLTTGGGCSRQSLALGAIASNPFPAADTGSYVDPYLDNYGAFAMLLAGPTDYGHVFSYIEWYLRNVNYSAKDDIYQGVPGTIFDYTVNPWTCTEASTGRYDSSDAYAGTFLSLVSAFARANNGRASYFTRASVQRKLKVIAGAIVATQGANGLTSALKDQQPYGQYTEDNIESSQGLADYAALLASEGEPCAAHWAAVASSIRAGIASYEWLPSARAYRDASDHSSASFTPCTAGIIQLWVAWDRQGTRRWRQSVIPRYTSGNPAWMATKPGYPDISCMDGHDPESATAYAAAQTGDAAGATSWLGSSQVNWVDAGRPYPWTVQDSGFRALTAYVQETGIPYLP